MPRRILIALLLLALNWVAFEQVRRCDFVNYDDPIFVTGVPRLRQGVTPANFKWAMTTQYAEYWHPLTWLSHMVDYQLFGPAPAAHHLMNLAFHSASAICLFLVFDYMTGQTWASAMIAGLFAVHPLHVESVAWVTERKDVLSAPFFFGTIGAFAAYVRRRSWWMYGLSVICFVLTLMAKPIGMTLPAVLLLVEFWPLSRTQIQLTPRASIRRLIVEIIPFAAIALLSASATVFAQQSMGTASTIESLGITDRVANALVSYVRYLAKLFLPIDLAVFYPHPGSWPISQTLSSAALLLLITLIALRWASSRPYLIVGWLWFLGTLLPVIGLVQVGSQSMADRYSYLPSVGIFFAVVWMIVDIPKSAAKSVVVTIASLCALTAFTIMTRQQVSYWRNTETLFTHAAAVTTENWVASLQLGDVAYANGDLKTAANDFADVIRLQPNRPKGYNNLGLCWLGVDPSRSVQLFEKTVQLEPSSAEYRVNLAAALSALGRYPEAMDQCREALRLDANYIPAQQAIADLTLREKTK